MNNSPLIFGTADSEYLADDIAKNLPGAERGLIVREEFKDGEGRIMIPNDDEIRGRNVLIVGSTHNAEAHAELCDLLSAMRQAYNASSVRGVIPYFGYGTAERYGREKHEMARGIFRAQALFDTRPDTLFFVDLHAEGIKDVGGREGRADHMYSEPLIVSIINEVRNHSDAVLVAPDVGRGKWVQSLAKRVDLPSYVLGKERVERDTVHAVGEVPNLKGRLAIMFDDMIRTGGTSITQAERCKDEAGAEKVILISTHSVLPGNAEERMHNSQAFDQIHVTNTHPRSQSITLDKFTVHNIAPLIAGRILPYYE